MEMLLTFFQKKVTKAIRLAFPSFFEESTAEITPSTQEEFGHYQCNSALRLAKIVQQNPRIIAQKIVDHLDHSMCEKVEIEGPGFINFTLLPSFLSHQLQEQLFD